jgi:glycosyltransferase involved in cell wall biosynthesis
LTKHIIIIGPAHPYRGGLATFDERLATEFTRQGHDSLIYNFTLQYPSFLFPGTTQYSDQPAPANVNIVRKINSVNPFNWWRVGMGLKKRRPDFIVVRFWMPFMGPAFGTILRLAKKNGHTKVIAIADNIIAHEKRPGDVPFTKYFLKACDGFIVMSDKVMKDLRSFEPLKPAIQVLHPLYDSFGDAISKTVARRALGIEGDEPLMLFFGFIRKYKGLDILLEALKILKEKAHATGTRVPRLVVAGEFYEDEKPYLQKIDQLGIKSMLILKTAFIPDNEVRNYFCAADVVIQPYRSATQSGVTPLAFHYEKPMIVTNVGALPDYVPDGLAGLVTEPDPPSLAAAIERYFQLGEQYFLPHLREEKKKYSWQSLTDKIVSLAENTAAGGTPR